MTDSSEPSTPTPVNSAETPINSAGTFGDSADLFRSDGAARLGQPTGDASSLEASPGRLDRNETEPSDPSERSRKRVLLFGFLCLEWAILLFVFATHGGGGVPHVNEAHYLCKAKHFWEPSWCERDLFLGSQEAHGLFYLLFGWLTRWFSLEVTAWITRWICWGLLAAAWVRLSRTMISTPFVAVLSGWAFSILLTRTHMSGEWVVGGAEAKVIAYCLLWMGLAAVIQARWYAVWPWLGASAAFHVLVGGWAVLAALFAYLFSKQQRPSLKQLMPSLMFGGLLSMIGLVPALLLTMQAETGDAVAANQIYVFERLSHHLVFAAFPRAFVIRHLSLVAIAVALWFTLWKQPEARRLGAFGVATFLIALIGIGVDEARAASDNPLSYAGLLKFYWFRLSDAVIPVLIALLAFRLGERLLTGVRRTWWWGGLGFVAFLMLMQLSLQIRQGGGEQPPAAVRQSLAWSDRDSPELREWKWQLYQDWMATCDWARTQTHSQSMWLTPRNQQTFKWYAQRAEVVNWKDVPQDAATIVTWRRRMRDIYEYPVLGPLNLTDEELLDLASDYEVDYLLVEKRNVLLRERIGAPLPFRQVYPESGRASEYLIYRVLPSTDAGSR